VPDPQVVRHHGVPQVDVAVLQAQLLRRVFGLIQLKRQRCAGVQDLDLAGHHLDRAGGLVRVDHVSGTGTHHTSDSKHRFEFEILGRRQGLPVFENHLHDTVPIPQIDKHDPTQVPDPAGPAGQFDFGTDEVFQHFAAAVRSHHSIVGCHIVLIHPSRTSRTAASN